MRRILVIIVIVILIIVVFVLYKKKKAANGGFTLPGIGGGTGPGSGAPKQVVGGSFGWIGGARLREPGGLSEARYAGLHAIGVAKLLKVGDRVQITVLDGNQYYQGSHVVMQFGDGVSAYMNDMMVLDIAKTSTTGTAVGTWIKVS